MNTLFWHVHNFAQETSMNYSDSLCTTRGRVSIIQALREERRASTIWIIHVIHVGDLTSVHKSLVETLPTKISGLTTELLIMLLTLQTFYHHIQSLTKHYIVHS